MNDPYTNNIQKNQEILLSIGMIVKNEASVLRRCLESLQPLRDAIPCQLLIADTGSSDNTPEIAKEYTDEVYEFKWCDDFSAARNSGIERARGKWFLFVDADEWFEDVSELITFFQSGDYRSYGHAAYYIRNYVRMEDRQETGDMLGVRLAERRKESIFVNKIHEALITTGRKKILSKTFAGHSGYAIDNGDAFLKEKEKRNIALLKMEMEAHPEDPCNYWYMAKQYPMYVQVEEHFKYIEQAYQAVQQCREHLYYSPIVRNYILCLYLKGDMEQAADEIRQYWSLKRKDSIFVETDLTYQMMLICLNQNNYRQALSLLSQYRECYQRIEREELQDADYMCESLSHSAENYRKSFLLEAFCQYKLGDVECAYGLILKTQLQELGAQNYKECIQDVVRICMAADACTYLVTLYQQVGRERTGPEVQLFEQSIEHVLRDIRHQDREHHKKRALCEAFCASSGADAVSMLPGCSDYIGLQQVRKMLLMNDRGYLPGKNAVQELMKKDIILLPEYAEVLFAAWWCGLRIEGVLKDIEVDVIGQYTVASEEYLIPMETGLYELVHPYVQNLGTASSLKEHYYVLCTLEHILLAENGAEDGRRIVSRSQTELFDDYIRLGEAYMKRLYAGVVLTEEQISIVPRHFRFFYYAGRALCSREQNFVLYGELIRKALEQCPLFTVLVQASLQLFEEELSRKEQQARLAQSEFGVYAKVVKEKIAAMIAQGKKDEARTLITAYEKVNPADVDGLTLLYSLLEKEDYKYQN